MTPTGWLLTKQAAENFNIGDRVKILEGTIVGFIDEGEREALTKDMQGVVTGVEPNPMYPAISIILVSVKTDEGINLEVSDGDLEKLPDESVQASKGTTIQAQDIPTEEEQEVQQNEWPIGDVHMWTPGQLSVIAQKPIEELGLQENKVFKYLGGVFEVGKIEADQIAIKRIASEMTSEYPLTNSPENFNPEDFYTHPVSEYPGHQLERVRTVPKSGELSLRDHKPGELPGTEVVEKVKVLGPELKSPHVPSIRSPQYNEPQRNDRRFSSIPSPEIVASMIQERFAECMKPVQVLAMQGFNVRSQLEANYGAFENSVIEDFRGLYPEMVDRLIHGYAEVKNHIRTSDTSSNLIPTRG